MNEAKVCAVVVTYNRKELLCKCLDAILNQDNSVFNIVVVDNCSTDGTIAFLEQQGFLSRTNIDVLQLDKNTGGAGGFYAGMKRAMNYHPNWVWIMDDDVIPEKDCLGKLLEANEHASGLVSFFASAVRGINGEAMNVPKINRAQFSKYTDWYEYLEYGMVKIVKATFVSLLFNAEAIEKCGYPWAPFFIWGDDSEYTQRVIRDYGPAYMVGSSKVIHLRSGSDELSLVKETNIKRIPLYFYYYRNNLIGFWEYESILYRFLCLGKLGYDFFGVLFFGRHKMKKCGVIIKAFFAFLFGTYDRNSFKNRANV